MLRRNQKQSDTWVSDTEAAVPFLGEEGVENPAMVAIELRNRMATVEQQVLSQYTATAAYVTLAQQHTDEARAEARSDLDRVQATMIGLIEQVRADVKNRLDCANIRPELPGTALTIDVGSRMAALEDRLQAMVGALESCVRENMALRQQLDELMLERNRAEGWLFATGNTSDLSLH